MGAGYATVTPPALNATAVAQTVWSYTPRSLTDIQSLTAAIQNNDPGAVTFYNDFLYVPVPYYAEQVTADQVATFIDNAIRNYNLLNVFAGFITNNPYGLWTPNAVGAFLSSQNMSQTSVALLLSYAGATQMAQALSYLSGNYTNVVMAFNIMSPTTGATVMGANMSASQAAMILSHPLMPITQAILILSNSAMPVTQAANILSNMVNYNATEAAQILISLSTSQIMNIVINPGMSCTSLATILGNAVISADTAQFILYQLANNYYYNKWTCTVAANEPPITFSTNVTLATNVLIANNITIMPDVTVSCGTSTCYFVTQLFNNYGTVVNGNGAINATGPGTGGGGIVIIAGTNKLGSVVVAGGTGGPAKSTYIGGTGVLYVAGNVTLGMGGTGAYYSSATYQGAGGAPFGVPGGGGGATGGPVVLYSFSSNNSMLTYILQGLSDWWLLYVLNKSPASTTPLLYMYGAGGGGGQNANGGGEGGEVIAYGNVIVDGNINAQGGGSDGSYGATGSGGGGGGVVYVFYGLAAGQVSINVAGGNGGNASYPGGTGGTGIAVLAAIPVNG